MKNYEKIYFLIELVKTRFHRLINYNKKILDNALTSINISTYDGSGQVVHPCVIDFKNEHGIEKWGGYRYWMVISPYPYSNDSLENPCLYCSNDGISWLVPKGITNPLDCAEGGWENGFNNDPDMIYDPDEDKLFIYYRFANKKELKVNLIKINKDMICDKIINVMYQSPWNHSINKSRSLCIWRESGDKWHMWGGGGTSLPPYNIYYFFSSDGVNWEEPKRCVNKWGTDPLRMFDMYNWHISCKPNYRENRIEFFSYSRKPVGILRRVIGFLLRKIFHFKIKEKDALIYAQCDMNEPSIFYSPIKDNILSSSNQNWDCKGLYRSSFQIYDTGESYFYKVWYTAVGKDGVWGLGYTTGLLGTKYSGEKCVDKT